MVNYIVIGESMHKFLHILEHSLLDTLKILPVLLLVYFLIEFLEYKQAGKLNNLKFLNKKHSSIFGAVFGGFPQCGFSVIATDLYAKRKVNIGALIAVYIATSDEALPILISNPSSFKVVLPLLALKILIASVIGWLTQFVFDNISLKKQNIVAETITNENDKREKQKTLKEKVESKTISTKTENLDRIKDKNKTEVHKEEKNNHSEEKHHIHNDEEESENLKIEEIHSGCCHHNIEHKHYDWKHPLLHSLKIIGIILIVNIIFGCLIEFGFKGEENLKKFLTSNTIFLLQPLLAMLVGFIPNCASSVVLTDLFIIGALSFGSLLAGLIVNAGLGLILLFKQNKNIKENIIIVSILMATSLAFGYFLHFIL